MASRILLSPLGLYSLLGFATTPWRLGLKCLLGSVASQAPPHRLSGSMALLRCYCLLGSIASPALLLPTRLYRPFGLCYHLSGSITSWTLLSGDAFASGALNHLSGLAIASRSLSPLRLCYRLSGSAASRALPLPLRALSSRALPSH